jgi:mannitol/fructose-specific phosphotransferase system IIA component (Ntr-type)
MTLPHATDSAAVVATARHLNPKLRILVRARYLRERDELEQAGATAAVFEEAEAAVALSRLVLADTGASPETVERSVREIRTRLLLDNVSNLASRVVRDIMIPWTRVRRLSNAARLEEIRTQIQSQHYSRWPVVDAQTHLPMGYLLVKDLVGFDAVDGVWTELIRPLSALRPVDTIESALRHMQQEGATVCLVADGQSPVGMITIEDILEQVVGRMEDEYPRHPKLVLHELAMTTDRLLDLSGDTMDQAIAELAAAIPAERLPSGANIAELAIARERELPANVGCGVAIPHARCPNLQDPLIVVGRSNRSIAAGDSHSAPVQLLFLLVTPAERPDLQIVLLSGIASLAANPDIRRRLLEARSPLDVQLILADAM